MDASEQAYYEARVGALAFSAAGGVSGSSTADEVVIRVSHSGDVGGKVLLAGRSLAAGEVAWIESPLVGMAHLATQETLNRGACDNCLRPIGALRDEWRRCGEALDAAAAAQAKKKKKKGKAASAVAEEATNASELQVQLPEMLPCTQVPASEASGSATSAAFDLRSIECEPIPCSGGCTVRYCSVECRDSSWQACHALLCGSNALAKHALANNEVFLLAAQAAARMAMTALGDMRERAEVARSFTQAEITAQPSPLTFALQLNEHLSTMPPADAITLRESLASCAATAAYPFTRFCGSVWWEHVTLPADIDPDEEEDYRARLCGVVEQSVQLFHEHLESKLQLAATATTPFVELDTLISSLQLDEIFSLALFNRLLSSFELNNIGFHAPTALGLYVHHVTSLSPEEHASTVAQLGSFAWSALQERMAKVGSVVEGTGLFALGCCMNHSCSPNITLLQKVETDAADWPHGMPSCARLDRSGVFIALRDIAAGEELNISYIDLLQPRSTPSTESDTTSAATASSLPESDLEEVGFEQRQQALRAYQFECACTKCALQR